MPLVQLMSMDSKRFVCIRKHGRTVPFCLQIMKNRIDDGLEVIKCIGNIEIKQRNTKVTPNNMKHISVQFLKKNLIKFVKRIRLVKVHCILPMNLPKKRLCNILKCSNVQYQVAIKAQNGNDNLVKLM